MSASKSRKGSTHKPELTAQPKPPNEQPESPQDELALSIAQFDDDERWRAAVRTGRTL